MRALTEVEQHFAFGDNWASYARLITEEHVARAVAAIERLFGDIDLHGRTFLDIGCGSGIHAVAASRLGAKRVVAIDIDEQSVATARATIASLAPNADATTLTASILDSSPAQLGSFDVVYSWGVLHHTGAMWEAVEKAAALVAPGGILAIALYRKTPLCGFWRIEKRMYSRAPRWIQSSLINGYIAAYRLKCLLTGKDFHAAMDASKQQRGMDYRHDVHDWLGGYPYESASPDEVHAHFARLGLTPVREFCQSAGLGFTVHCDEYVARRA